MATGGRVARAMMMGTAALAIVIAMGGPAQAQRGPAQIGTRYEIGAQPLAGALAAWSARSGIRVQSIPDTARAVVASAVDADLNAAAALDALLQGTGYSFRFTRVDAVVIEAIPTGGLNGAIGTVRVQGTTDIATQGVNGSTDPTATEGSDSYAADQTTVATKNPLAIKDTPQSVSVVTQQQLLDRNITDLQTALSQAPGISTVFSSSVNIGNETRSNMTPGFFSRGFELTRLQIDGGAVLNIRNNDPNALKPQINLAAYDHIEVLRGADGLYNGQGAPGGVINLQRKRPLDHAQLVVSQIVGSFDTYNTSIDGTGPIGFGGDLRARIVLNRQSNGYFYRIANTRQYLVFATLEAQLTGSTLISGGVNYQSQQSTPFYGGLPAAVVDGKYTDLRLPLSTCLCFPTNREESETPEFFASLDQSFGPNWKLTARASRVRQSSSSSYLTVVGTYGSLDPALATRLNDSFSRQASTQQTFDANLAGAFQLFGQSQKIVIGANYAAYDGGGGKAYVTAYRFAAAAPRIDVFNFDPYAYSQPEVDTARPLRETLISKTHGIGAYATLIFSPFKRLHFTAGVRYDLSGSREHIKEYCTFDFGCDEIDGLVEYGGVIKETRSNFQYGKFFPFGYLAANFDITPTLAAYVSKTSIYINNAANFTVDDQPLAPTTGNNFEGGLKYASADHRLTASINGFYLKQNGFPFVVDPLGVPNIDPVTSRFPNGHQCCFANDPNSGTRSYGAEAEVAGQLRPGLDVSISLGYNNQKIISDPGLPQIAAQGQAPQKRGSAFAKYTFQPGSRLRGGYVGLGVSAQGGGLVYASYCNAANAEFGFCIDERDLLIRTPALTLASLQAGWALGERLSIALTVNNLLDKRYYKSFGLRDGGNWYGDPRNAQIAFRSKF